MTLARSGAARCMRSAQILGAAIATTMLALAHASASTSGALYYKLNDADVQNNSAWPAAFRKYGIIVADPGLRVDVLAQVRRELPQVKLLAYTCMSWAYVTQPCTNCSAVLNSARSGRDVPDRAAGERVAADKSLCSGCPGTRCVDVLDRQGQPYWNSSWNVQNLRDGRAVCPFGGLNQPVVPVAAWIPGPASSRAMARFHAEVTMASPGGYDGLYVDEYAPQFKATWAQYAQAITAADPPSSEPSPAPAPAPGALARCARYNPDEYGRRGTPAENCSARMSALGDGTNSTLAQLQAQYSAWRPYYTAQLRRLLGPNATLIANVPVPAASDPSLDGITVEFEHCRGSGSGNGTLDPACAETLLAQKALSEASGRTPVVALWLTHAEMVPAAEQCEQLRAARAQLGPWLREGDDITDCTREGGAASCVHCDQIVG